MVTPPHCPRVVYGRPWRCRSGAEPLGAPGWRVDRALTAPGTGLVALLGAARGRRRASRLAQSPGPSARGPHATPAPRAAPHRCDNATVFRTPHEGSVAE